VYPDTLLAKEVRKRTYAAQKAHVMYKPISLTLGAGITIRRIRPMMVTNNKMEAR
jgi:hypothetical protein